MTPMRIQRSRARGWQMPANTVYVGRPTKWGNPFDLRRSEHCWTAIAHGFKADLKGRRAASVAMFAAWISGGKAAASEGCGLYADDGAQNIPIRISPELKAGPPPSITDIRTELGGRNLACWCRLDQRCHADVLLHLANRPEGAA